MSYSHAVDGALAPGLQRGLHQFAKPWYRMRALRVFRDEEDLSANPGLWGSIEAALDSSDFFILLASPDAAHSRWVTRELAYWCQRKATNTILIILTDGDVVWDDFHNDFDWRATTALPESLRGIFDEEPRWIDLRSVREGGHFALSDLGFKTAVAEVAAPLHGKDKADLLGEDARQHRRTRRLATSAIVGLVALTLAAATGAIVAVDQRNDARMQERLALTRFLAATSLNEPRIDRSLLFGLHALNLQPSPESPARADALAALLSALQREPRIVKYLQPAPPTTRDATEAIRSFEASKSVPHGLAFSPDGRSLALGNHDRVVSIWNVDSGRRLHELRGHETNVEVVRFTPDGKRLLSGTSDPIVMDWDVSSGRMVKDPLSLGDVWMVGNPVALSADGTRFAVFYRGEIALWDVPRGIELARMIVHQDEEGAADVATLALTPDGKTLAAGHLDGRTALFDATTAAPLSEPLEGHVGPPTALVFSPDGQTLASGGVDGRILTWDVVGRRRRGEPLIGHARPVTALEFSSDGAVLASGGEDRRVLLWDVSTGKPAADPFQAHGATIRGIAFSPDGQTIASSDAENQVITWARHPRLAMGSLLAQERAAVNSLSLSPRHDAMAVATGVGEVVLRNPLDGGVIQTLSDLEPMADEPEVVIRDRLTGQVIHSQPPPDHKSPARTVAWSPRGDVLVLGRQDGYVFLWEIQDGMAQQRRLSIPNGGPVGQMAINKNGTTLAVAARDEQLVMWDLERDKRLPSLPGSRGERAGRTAGGGRAQRVAFGSSGRLFAAADDDTVRMWELPTDGVPAKPSPEGHAFAGHRGWVNGLAFSPDDAVIASASDDSTVILWDVERLEPRAVLSRHEGPVNAVAFDPTGTLLATGGQDRSIRLWDVRSGRPIGLVGTSFGAVTTLTFGVDGSTLLSGDKEGNVMKWNTGVGWWEGLACQQVNRDLTGDERSRYLSSAYDQRIGCP